MDGDLPLKEEVTETEVNKKEHVNGGIDNPVLDSEISNYADVQDGIKTDDMCLNISADTQKHRRASILSKASSRSNSVKNGDMPADEHLKKRHVSIQIAKADEEETSDETGISSTQKGNQIDIDVESPLLYNITDSPPIHLTILLGFQQCLLSISGSLIIPLLVADAVCAKSDGVILTQLLSSTMMMNGITTLLQTLLGVRLPLFQGPSASYIVPLIALNKMEPERCDITSLIPAGYNSSNNMTLDTDQLHDELVSLRLTQLMGPLILCGFLHCMIGFTGLVGFMMRFIGPITIVPSILLIGLYIVKPTLDYVPVHWGVSAFTWGLGVILSMVIGPRPMPIPFYTRTKGFHFIWYPVHQVFAILISILLGWLLSAILTYAGAFTDDPTNIEYMARTDARSDLITKSDWFYFPYPGQFGAPGFTLSAFIGFFIATITSILDSIGDYYACATTCRAPPPPGHAVNRGIAIEGFGSMLSGFMGIGHATTTYGGNIGAIGMTRVASRRVFVVMSIIYLVFGVFAKLSAVFVSIPYPVLGGCLIVIVGVFVGVNLSNLQTVDLASNRNLAIIGMSIFVGLLVPTWVEDNPEGINTGNSQLDTSLKILLGSPNFIGSILACVLDNVIAGTAEERGIAAWMEDDDDIGDMKDKDTENSIVYAETIHVYDPLLPASVANSKVMKYLPIFPYKDDQKDRGIRLDRRPSHVSNLMMDLPQDVYDRRKSSVRRMSLGVSLYL